MVSLVMASRLETADHMDVAQFDLVLVPGPQFCCGLLVKTVMQS